jgi:cysteinyl-tRNA synthetase
MDDDFNTALAIGNIFELVRCINRVAAEGALTSANRQLLERARAAVAEIGGVLGIFTSVPAEYLARIKERKAGELDIPVEEIERLVAERAAARKAKDFKRSDEIRDELLARNIELLDGPQGTSWKVK